MEILIVDDEKDIKSLFEQKFRSEIRNKEIVFRFCFSAEEAISFLSEKTSPELVLILSDINMPGMNGLELLREIKKNFSHLKVFMITAYDDEDKYSQALKYGADNYLTKPIDFDLLKNAIKEKIK